MARKKTRIGRACKTGTGNNKHKHSTRCLQRQRLPTNHATNPTRQPNRNVEVNGRVENNDVSSANAIDNNTVALDNDVNNRNVNVITTNMNLLPHRSSTITLRPPSQGSNISSLTHSSSRSCQIFMEPIFRTDSD